MDKFHRFTCYKKDIIQDPLRTRVGSHKLRNFRKDCIKCQKRIYLWEEHKDCREIPKFKYSQLCLYCDQWKTSISKHRKKCKPLEFFIKNRTKLIKNYLKREKLYFKRVHKFPKKEDTFKRPPYLRLNLVEPNPIPKPISKLEPSPQVLRVSQIYNTDLETAKIMAETIQHITKFPSRMCLNYAKLSLNPNPIQKLQKPLEEEAHQDQSPLSKWEKNALVGLKTWDEYLKEQHERHMQWRQRMEALSLVDEEVFIFWEKLKTGQLFQYPERKTTKEEILDVEIASLHEEDTDVKKDGGREDDDQILVPATPKTSSKDPTHEFSPKFLEILDKFTKCHQRQEDEDMLVCGTPRREERENRSEVPEHSEEPEETQFIRLGKRDQARKEIIKIYQECFLNFNSVMKRWISNHITIYFKKRNQIMGCFTYRILKKKQIEVLNVLLFCIRKEFQDSGNGREMMEEVKKRNKLIILWADEDSTKFYSKMDFEFVKYRGEEANLIPFEDNSVMMMHGYTDKIGRHIGIEDDPGRNNNQFLNKITILNK